MSIGRVLIVAGSDPSGGAGLQADIKTVTVLGGYAMAAVTAVTVQNTLGVTAVHPVAPEIVAAQMRACLDDIGADAVKLGMLGGWEVAAAVADVLADYPGVPVVLDPVMVAKGGAALLDEDAVSILIERLLPLAAVVTPNAPELGVLTGTEVEDEADLLLAAQELVMTGARAVLAKGGHLAGGTVVDYLVTGNGPTRYTSARVDSRHTHGTGCTLASALAVGLAQGLALPNATARARDYVHHAILAAPGLGQGHGPLGHGWMLLP